MAEDVNMPCTVGRGYGFMREVMHVGALKGVHAGGASESDEDASGLMVSLLADESRLKLAVAGESGCAMMTGRTGAESADETPDDE